MDGDVITEVTLVHSGGLKYDPVYGVSYTITDISPVHKGVSQDWFTFEQDGTRYKAIINKKFKPNNGCYIVDLTEVQVFMNYNAVSLDELIIMGIFDEKDELVLI